jgi:dimethylamine monooxygenase subunit A
VDADFRFDFDQIAVPFRMRPGLSRLTGDASRLIPLREGSTRATEKRLVMQASASRHMLPGFDPVPAIESIADHALSTWARGQFDAQIPLELAFEEDFAVLDGPSGRLVWLCVCTPSHWAPEDKIGLTLDAVHRPVADSAALTAATAHLVQLVTAGACWQRFVWTISPSPRYDQHPRRHPRAAWPETADPAGFAAQCWMRAERQTFFRSGAARNRPCSRSA